MIRPETDEPRGPRRQLADTGRDPCLEREAPASSLQAKRREQVTGKQSIPWDEVEKYMKRYQGQAYTAKVSGDRYTCTLLVRINNRGLFLYDVINIKKKRVTRDKHDIVVWHTAKNRLFSVIIVERSHSIVKNDLLRIVGKKGLRDGE